jgi:branched-chain amino acid transport system ATP-binding protein
MSTLDVSDLIVRYGRLEAVHELSLHVEGGDIAIVVGANGAGKTSAMSAIAGSIRAADGRVVLDGRDITGWSADRIARLGMVQVPQGRRVFAPLTVRQNLVLGGYTRPRGRRVELIGEMEELFGILAERADTPAGLLSGGEQQMLAFARALMSEPSVLLLDEPCMGLAPVMVDAVLETVREIAGRGIAVVMAEQNAAAFQIGTRAYLLETGRVVLDGPAAEVRDHPLVLRAFFGLTDELDTPAKR